MLYFVFFVFWVMVNLLYIIVNLNVILIVFDFKSYVI